MDIIDMLLIVALAAVFLQNYLLRRKLIRFQEALKEIGPAISRFSENVDRAEKAVAGSAKILRAEKAVAGSVHMLRASASKETENHDDLVNRFHQVAQGGHIG